MKLAFSTNAFTGCTVLQAIEQIASLGYAGVELMFDTPHLWPESTGPADLEAVREALALHGVEVSNANAFMMKAVNDPRQPYWHPSWIEPQPDYRALRIRHTLASLRQADALGVPHISTEPGGPLDGRDRDECEQKFLEGVQLAAETAAEHKVQLLIEPEPGLLIETAAQAESFLRRIDSPWVGLNFDVGHQYCVGEDPAESLERLWPWVRHIHLEDIAATGVHHHLIPGHGAIDLKAFLARARKLDYRGWVTIELYPYQEAPREAARLAREAVLRLLDG